MTRFVFLTDTHIGHNPPKFHQQPTYPEQIAALQACLSAALSEEPAVDFILHGGDMVDHCSEQTILRAKQALHGSVPMYLSVGNHDLDREDSRELWLTHAPELFRDNSLEYRIVCGNCIVHVIPNQWERDKPYHWIQKQQPFFIAEQLEKLDSNIREAPEFVHIISVHNPIYGIPAEQTGFTEDIHKVDSDFRMLFLDLTRKYPQIKCVLSGHNHVNTLQKTSEALFVTASAFMEAPFEYKIVEVRDNSIKITTRSLAAKVPFHFEYDFNRTFVQGRNKDREVIWEWEK